MNTQSERNLLHAAIYVGSAAAVALCFLLHFYPPQQLHLPPCLFHELTGLYCPGCGAARALHHLMNLELLQAIQCNAFFVCILPFLIYILLQSLSESIGIKSLPKINYSPQLGRALAILIFLWFIIRNLPFHIFKIPA